MEWQNVTFGWDVDAFWLASHDHFIRRGYAWVGVSAQRVGVQGQMTGLKAWSPGRYGTLDVTQSGTFLNDDLEWDIFSQAAQAVRSPVPGKVDPMGGLGVERVIAIGASMSAARLVTYHNSIHPLAGVFDAFMPGLGGMLLRTDLDTKVLKFLTETEIAGNQAAFRKLNPDSDHFRRWEVAGASHIDFHVYQEFVPLVIRDLGSSHLPPTNCENPPFSRIPGYFALNAATEQLVRWVRDDILPSTATEIDVLSLGPPVVIARDSFGNALGGIRLSQLAVPTATNKGVNSPPPFCSLFGTFQPFDAGTLDALYPNHGTYVSQVTHTTRDNLKNGFIVPEDATATVQEAAQSVIGKK
jgi:hypothetical protein